MKVVQRVYAVARVPGEFTYPEDPSEGKTVVSIIVPANNEEGVICRCLDAMLGGSDPSTTEVVVVCNGCTDDTADIVRGVAPSVQVVETEVGCKVHALNMGDGVASTFPRFYVDADVIISGESLHQMAQHLKCEDVLAVSPQVRLDLKGASWAVRAFYDIDRQLPSARETIGGSGVYGVSEDGRKRWGKFPAVTADDAFVRRQFKPHERCVVEGAYSIVTPPKMLSGVIAIKTRSHFGNYELRKLYPELCVNIGVSNRLALIRLALRPWLWTKLAVYGYVKVVARMRAWHRIRNGVHAQWERDETSREPSGQQAIGSRR